MENIGQFGQHLDKIGQDEQNWIILDNIGQYCTKLDNMDKIRQYGQDKIISRTNGQYGHKKITNETKQIHRSAIDTRAMKTLEEQLIN